MNILSLREDELIKILLKRDFKAFRVKQIFEWIYQKKASSFDEMTNLPLDIRSFLNKNFKLYSLKLKDKQISIDEETKKYLFELEDGYLIETVLILSEKRRTICVSTQVGCSIRCTFCASGKKGFFRDLKAFEIIEQIIHITKDTNQSPTHIVFMGMGEP
ncbi:MAG: putative dual-specificity RNA methyltransferase RlmN, partial [Candidatus Anoxychlamydiales bacterium]|nr:putative dual-specificity RNA methyltransferase RlmN [Candidatus Anoxychlamydiales bacterium]